MSAAAHTPAPWRFRKCPCGDPICDRYRISVADGSGMFSREDARLVVASPRLLDALRELVAVKDLNDRLEVLGPNPATVESRSRLVAAWSEARAVVSEVLKP